MKEDKFSFLSIAVEAAPCAMVLTDEGGRIVLINRATENLFGYTREELIGSSVEKLLPDSYREKHNVERQEFVQHPEVRPMGQGRDLSGVSKEGRLIPLEIGLGPMRTERGLFVLAVLVDITERKRLEEDLKRSNAELKQFTYIASHDLQEPLRMVRSFTELLSKKYSGQLDQEANEFIYYVVDGAKRMQQMINDLLEYSRVGTHAGDLVPVDVGSVFQKVLSNLKIAIEESHAVITSSPLPRVTGDEGQLVRLFQNLTSNAIKFVEKGKPPKIHVASVPDRGVWIFSVNDNGIGIKPEDFKKIFGIFERLHSRQEYPGSGLGLAICKKIVERHEGRIWVESKPAGGSTFFFTLPASQSRLATALALCRNGEDKNAGQSGQ